MAAVCTLWTLLLSTSTALMTPTARRRSHMTSLAVLSSADEQQQQPKQRLFMVMNATEDALLVKKGQAEASLMQHNAGPLLPPPIVVTSKQPRVTTTRKKGFAVASTKRKKKTQHSKKAQPLSSSSAESAVQQQQTLQATTTTTLSSYAQALHKEGIVRIDNVLSPEVAEALQEYLVDLRERSRHAVEYNNLLDSQERFADVLLNQNRCDLKVPIGPPPVMKALHALLNKNPVVAPLIHHVFDSYDTTKTTTSTKIIDSPLLYELNCFMSQTGARRQLVHADNVCVERGLLQEDEPIMLTCFVALQDVDITRGPTTWILGTHNRAAHQEFYGEDPVPRQALLKDRPKVMGTLPQGSCAVFDPRTLHCAGANECADPQATRALWYVSFKNPRVDYPGCPSCGGYGIVDAELTLEELCQGLEAQQEQGEFVRRLDFLSCFP